jgi:predicted nucleotidyltransferase
MRGFKYHKHLCPKIWDSENRMDQLAVQSLCMMAWDFVRYLQFLGVPIKQSDVLDIVVHGSVTNYYWDSKSDIDLAIVADLSNVEKWVNGGNLYAMMKAFARSWRRTKPMKIAGRNIDIKLIDKKVIYRYYYVNKFRSYSKYDIRYLQYRPTTYMYTLMLSRIKELTCKKYTYIENRRTVKLIDSETKEIIYSIKTEKRQL